jgi:hypothetical protein
MVVQLDPSRDDPIRKPVDLANHLCKPMVEASPFRPLRVASSQYMEGHSHQVG